MGILEFSFRTIQLETTSTYPQEPQGKSLASFIPSSTVLRGLMDSCLLFRMVVHGTLQQLPESTRPKAMSDWTTEQLLEMIRLLV